MEPANAHPQKKLLKDYRVSPFFIPEINLKFDLHDQETFVTNQSLFKKNSDSTQNNDLFLEGEQLELISIKMNGEDLPQGSYSQTEKGLVIKNCPDEFNLETRVRLQPHLNKAFSGLYKTQKVFCTQMEAQGFRRTTFSLDRPDVMSKYSTTIVADKTKFPVLLSNGNCVEQKDLDNNQHQVVWTDPFPKPSYLFALVAGDLDWIEDSFLTRSKRKIALKIYVNKGMTERARFAMDSLKQAMTWDEDTYRLEYDLDVYNIVAVDDFNMGAMENKGLNIFNSKYVLASSQTATDAEFQAIEAVIGHEYFHNWSGNRVTCRDWFQLSLKEGLTVFRDQEFTSDMNSRPVKRIEDVSALRSRQFPEDAGPMAHPVRPQSYIAIDNFYTVTVYEKGAEVIRMLQTLLGQDLFKKGVAKYFDLFDGQAVTTDDWVHAMESVSGRDLTQFKNWYDQAGTPKVSVKTEYRPDEHLFKIQLKQECLDPISKQKNAPFVIPLQIGLVSEQGTTIDFSCDSIQRSGTLELTREQQEFSLKDVYKQPILSINREFSAPIHLDFEQSIEDLLLLMENDADSFNRWESAQKIYRHVLTDFYRHGSQEKSLHILDSLVEVLAKIITQGSEDPAFNASLLELPSPQYLVQFLDAFDPQRLDQAYHLFSLQLSEKLHEPLLTTYKQLQDKSAGHTPSAVALRRLKNHILHFLYRDNNEDGQKLFYQQFHQTQNMTDVLNALRRMSYRGGKYYEQAMSEFKNQWQNDPLVMNKWLSIQATSQSENSFASIQQTANSDTFDSSNPNKVFALLYTFAQHNWSKFHNLDEKTYEWFANYTIEIDKNNPQVASRLGSCFNIWKKLDKKFHDPIRGQLELIANSSPSENLYEIVSRNLENTKER